MAGNSRRTSYGPRESVGPFLRSVCQYLVLVDYNSNAAPPSLESPIVEPVNVSTNVGIDRVLMLIILAAQGLFAVGRWVQGREATGEDIKRIEKRVDEVEKRIDTNYERYHKKANELQASLFEMEAEYVSKETFGQFARRYEALEARYNAAHNGNH